MCILSQEHLEALFGKGHELTVKKMFEPAGSVLLCEEKVEVIGTKGSLKMSVFRTGLEKDTQVEVFF